MATVVRNKETGRRYVVVGAGVAIKDSVDDPQSGVCVCDAQGRIGWFNSTDLIVETVFGQRPDEILE